MDWPWIYGRLVTATGWTPETIDGISFCDVMDLLTYWSEEPPAHVVLALRYLGTSRKGDRVQAQQQEDARPKLQQVAPMLNQRVRPISDRNRQLFEYATGQLEKVRLGKYDA